MIQRPFPHSVAAAVAGAVLIGFFVVAGCSRTPAQSAEAGAKTPCFGCSVDGKTTPTTADGHPDFSGHWNGAAPNPNQAQTNAAPAGATADGRDPRAANNRFSRQFTCQNVTMAEFAERLPSLAPGYLSLPVEDRTGLNGSWTFSFAFSSIAQVAAARRAANPDGSNALSAAEPVDALTLFDALPKQLGLKLENRRRPMPVVVIDHVEQTPIE